MWEGPGQDRGCCCVGGIWKKSLGPGDSRVTQAEWIKLRLASADAGKTLGTGMFSQLSLKPDQVGLCCPIWNESQQI